jgi:hypothetical protein
MSARIAYDNTGSPYDVTRILNPDTQLDEAKYRAYSPLFLPTTFAVRYDYTLLICKAALISRGSYGLSFASITATIVHAFLYFRKQIYHQA